MGAHKGKTIPELLEYGGVGRVFEHFNENPNRQGGGDWVRTDLRYRTTMGYSSAVNKRRRVRNSSFEARPFMQPAFRAGMADFLKKLRNSIK
jgi:hypothetical protein